MTADTIRGTYLIQKLECKECGATFTKKALNRATAGNKRYCPNCGSHIRGVLDK